MTRRRCASRTLRNSQPSTERGAPRERGTRGEPFLWIEDGDDRRRRRGAVPGVQAADDLTRVAQQRDACGRPLGGLQHPARRAAESAELVTKWLRAGRSRRPRSSLRLRARVRAGPGARRTAARPCRTANGPCGEQFQFSLARTACGNEQFDAADRKSAGMPQISLPSPQLLRPLRSRLDGEDQRKHPLGTRPAQQPRGHGQRPAGVRKSSTSSTGPACRRQGCSQLGRHLKRAVQCPQPLRAVAARRSGCPWPRLRTRRTPGTACGPTSAIRAAEGTDQLRAGARVRG